MKTKINSQTENDEPLSRFIAQDIEEFVENPARCVIREADYAQTTPIVRQLVSVGHKSPFKALIAFMTAQHRKPIYWANSEGLRLIATHGCPHRAYASQ